MIVFDGAYLLSVRRITKMQASSFQKEKKKNMLRAIFAKMFRTIEHFSL